MQTGVRCISGCRSKVNLYRNSTTTIFDLYEIVTVLDKQMTLETVEVVFLRMLVVAGVT